MTTSTDTRKVTAYGAESIYIDGLTRGPVGGWSWDGKALRHPMGYGLVLGAAAAERVSAAVAAYVPAKSERLTGYQVSQLPEADRAGFEWDRDMDSDVGYYVRSAKPVPGTTEFTPADVVEVIQRRR